MVVANLFIQIEKIEICKDIAFDVEKRYNSSKYEVKRRKRTLSTGKKLLD